MEGRCIVRGAGDVDERPLEVEASDFQGGNFAYAGGRTRR